MAAGLATLELVREPGFHERLLARTTQLCDGLEAAARAAGVALATARVPGMFGLFFTDAERVETFEQVKACDVARFRRFFQGMLQRGVYFAPSAFEAGFLSSAHGEPEIEATVAAAGEVFAELAG
jgi:glutamate-1-semialdehyde 2,1-aminomutase